MQIDLTLLHGVKGPRRQGNLLLDHLLGARVEVLEGDDWLSLQPAFERKANTYRAQGETPFIIDCLDSGAQLETSGADTLKTMAVVYACYRSAQDGQAIHMEAEA